MRMLMAVAIVAVACVPGCGGGPNPQDEAKRKQEITELRNEMNSRFNELDKKFAGVLAMEQTAKSAVEEAKRMTKVTPAMIEMLKKQENMLQAQLEEVRAIIKRLEAGN